MMARESTFALVYKTAIECTWMKWLENVVCRSAEQFKPHQMFDFIVAPEIVKVSCEVLNN